MNKHKWHSSPDIIFCGSWESHALTHRLRLLYKPHLELSSLITDALEANFKICYFFLIPCLPIASCKTIMGSFFCFVTQTNLSPVCFNYFDWAFEIQPNAILCTKAATAACKCIAAVSDIRNPEGEIEENIEECWKLKPVLWSDLEKNSNPSKGKRMTFESWPQISQILKWHFRIQ